MSKPSSNKKRLQLVESIQNHADLAAATQHKPKIQPEGNITSLWNKKPKNDYFNGAKINENPLNTRSPFSTRFSSLANISGVSWDRRLKQRTRVEDIHSQNTYNLSVFDKTLASSPYSKSTPKSLERRKGLQPINTNFFAGKNNALEPKIITHKELNSVTRENIIKEKEELRKTIRTELMKYQAEKQNSEKISKDFSKLEAKMHFESIKRISASRRPQFLNKKEVPLDFLFPVAPTTSTHFLTEVSDLSPIKGSDEKKNHYTLSKGAASSSQKNYFFNDPIEEKSFSDQAGHKESVQNVRAMQAPIIDANTVLIGRERKNTNDVSANENKKKPTPKNPLHVGKETEYEEFESLRDSLWAEEMKNMMTQKNTKRMENLMNMDIGKMTDELDSELFKAKKTRKNNMNLQYNKGVKLVRYANDSLNP